MEDFLSEIFGLLINEGARLLQKVYEVDPLVCPLCRHKMRVVSVVTDPAVIKRILNYLEQHDRSPP